MGDDGLFHALYGAPLIYLFLFDDKVSIAIIDKLNH